MKQVYVKPNQIHVNYMPYSEVMMHMKLAGKVMPFELIRNDSGNYTVQLYSNGVAYSSPVLPGEAGLYFDEQQDEFYYNLDVKVNDLEVIEIIGNSFDPRKLTLYRLENNKLIWY